jgi:hypothetical protein
MKFSNDFWDVYDAAQKDLSNDPEYCQIELEIRATLECFKDLALLERLTNAMQMQSTLLANEIYEKTKL